MFCLESVDLGVVQGRASSVWEVVFNNEAGCVQQGGERGSGKEQGLGVVVDACGGVSKVEAVEWLNDCRYGFQGGLRP